MFQDVWKRRRVVRKESGKETGRLETRGLEWGNPEKWLVGFVNGDGSSNTHQNEVGWRGRWVWTGKSHYSRRVTLLNGRVYREYWWGLTPTPVVVRTKQIVVVFTRVGRYFIRSQKGGDRQLVSLGRHKTVSGAHIQLLHRDHTVSIVRTSKPEGYLRWRLRRTWVKTYMLQVVLNHVDFL